MSAASEKAARECRENMHPPTYRWWVFRSAIAWLGHPSWVVCGPYDRPIKKFPTHAEAIAYATEQAREEARR